MNKASFIVLSLVVLLVVFAFGAFLGMAIQAQKDSPNISKAVKAIQVLTSKAVTSAVVYGQVTKIEGRTVTVTFNGDSVSVKLKDNAAVASFSSAGGSPQTMELSQVQTGQTVSINSKIQADGTLQGESLIVLPNR